MPDLHDVPVSGGPDGHLSRDELIVWRDDGAGDRDRIVMHLAACGACRRMAASLERIRPADAAPARFDQANFVEQGYAARPGGVAARSWRLPPIAVAAAAVLLLAAVLVPAWLLRQGGGSSTVQRGGEAPVTLTRPVGRVSADTLIFEWKAESPLDGARLLVFDLDRPGDPLISRDVTATRYEPTADERQRLPRGRELLWFIEYRIGGSTATTPAARFRVE